MCYKLFVQESVVFWSVNKNFALETDINYQKSQPGFKEFLFSVSTMHRFTGIACAVVFLSLVLTSSTSLALSPTGDLPVPSPLEEHNMGIGSCMYAYINTTYNMSNGMIHSDNMESGKYGESYVGAAYGVLIHVRSAGTAEPTACTLPLMTYSTPDGRLPVSEPWIALIKRGQCEFAVKVMNALRNNASAVLVYNDKETHVLDKMRIPPELGEYPNLIVTCFTMH